MDLNIVVEADGVRDPPADIVRKLQTAERLGYRTIAVSVVVAAGKAAAAAVVPPPPYVHVPDPCRMRVLTRLTILLSDSNIVYKLMQQPAVKQYDLLAIHPTSDKILNQVSSGSLAPDILTFDFSERLVVDLKRANLTLPRTASICFEINYTQAFSSQTGRSNTISSAQLLIEKTKGRNVIVSSGARSAIMLRSPRDVANLALLFGMNQQQGKSAVFVSAELALKHAASRRNSTSVAVTIASDTDPKDIAMKKRLSQCVKTVNPPLAKKSRVN